MENIVDSKVTGKRTIMGTDWPIETVLYKLRGAWLIVTGLCNGVPANSRKFPTLAQAKEFFDAQ